MSIRIGPAGLKLWIGTFLFLIAVGSAVHAEPAKRVPSHIVYSDDYAYPPYSGLDSNGEPSGFSVELIQAIGREIGVSVEVRLLPWTQVRTALETERSVDVAAMFYSAERDQVVDFCAPHATVTHEIFLRRDSPRISSLEDLYGKHVLVED
ncbi:MAG: transporter substrate-binding domain-containing protein, partial [Verrucomicrobiaceae bacterium]